VQIQKAVILKIVAYYKWHTAPRCFMRAVRHAVRHAFRSRSLTVANSDCSQELFYKMFQLDRVCSNYNNGMYLVKMNKMTGTTCSLLECSFRITHHVRVLSRFVESRVAIRCWTSS